ncbi:MAG: aminoacetone oxidase family FAD-binding enzyme [Lachnospiraceae bacterium]|nr:aminoacetone oxidase family FAD-binding enzyme [Lachnospiraceae bacterium]
MTDICVIGGGPAGVMAAYAAASCGKKVTLIDRNEEPLKKLLLTGNGKCNYSNADLKSDAYNFGKDHPFWNVLKEYDSEWLEEFFKERGMLTYKKDSLKYPRSERSDSLKNLLMDLLSEKNVEIVRGKKVVSVKKTSEDGVDGEYNEGAGVFDLTFEDSDTLECGKLVIATGGKAYPSLGSDGAGYRLARELGHNVSFTYPVLTRLMTDEKDVNAIAGVRFKAKVSAEINGETVAVEEGELQFNDNALSGICIFNLSRSLSKPLEENAECYVIADFLPEMEKEELKEYLDKIQGDESERFFESTFGEKTANLLQKRIKESGSDAVSVIKEFRIKISGHDSFNQAQVTKGGVNIDEVDGNMASKICSGLFFAGEVLDVDGKCGGYNLHFAFASGYKAGISAGR